MARWRWLRPGHLGSEGDRATFRTLHTVSLMAAALRTGLSTGSAERSARHLRSLLSAPAVALTDTEGLLAWDGSGRAHVVGAARLAQEGVADGSTTVRDHADFAC